MIVNVLPVLPLYVVIFVIFVRFRRLIKAMSNFNDLISDLTPVEETVDKREFLREKIKSGESICATAKTPWTEKRLQKANDKTVDRLYEKYQNPPPQKVNKQEALKLGQPICPVVIDLYAEGLKAIVDKLPYVGGKYTVNVFKLKTNISTNRAFCDTIAVKIGSRIIEQMGADSPLQMGVSLATMTWDALEPVELAETDVECENKE